MPWMTGVVLKNGSFPKALRGVPRGERGSPVPPQRGNDWRDVSENREGTRWREKEGLAYA